MKNSSLICLTAISCLSVGFTLGQQRNNPLPVRAEILQEMRKNQVFLNECSENMKNQFTPGYKANAIFSRLQDGRTHIMMGQGEIFHTQNPTNLALNGAGFFVLEHDGKTSYTRDGRFEFRSGRLQNQTGFDVVGYPLDSQQRQTSEKAQPIALQMDSRTGLYGGKYTGFHFDEHGILLGENKMTDPVTGQTATTNEPLFQTALVSFTAPENLKRDATQGTLFTPTEESGAACKVTAGGVDEPVVTPGSLELANIDYSEQIHVFSALRTYSGLFYDPGAQPMVNLPMAKFQSDLFKAPPATTIGIVGNGGAPASSDRRSWMDPMKASK